MTTFYILNTYDIFFAVVKYSSAFKILKSSFHFGPFIFVVFVKYLSTAIKIFVFRFIRRSKMLKIQIVIGSNAWTRTEINKSIIWISIVYTNVNTAQTISCSRCLFAIFKSTVDLEILHLLFKLDYNRNLNELIYLP